MAGVEDSKNVVVQINKLKFTYPGIDGAPPPGAKPLIEDFSLTLGAGDRCLLVGANGAGLSRNSFFFTKCLGIFNVNIDAFNHFNIRDWDGCIHAIHCGGMSMSITSMAFIHRN